MVCVLVVIAAGALLAGNTRKTITASDWVDHTQEVLNTLRAASQINERVDANSHLYLLTKDPNRLETVRGNATNLEVTTTYLKGLVADNRDDDTNVAALTQCSNELVIAMHDLKPGDEQPRSSILHCQQTINRMLDMERRLLLDRSARAHRVAISSLTTDFVFAGLSVMLLLTLFGFLMRAAELRSRGDMQIGETTKELEAGVRQLQAQANETALMSAARDELQLCVNLQEIYEAAKIGFARLLPSTGGALCMITNSRNMMETMSSWGEFDLEDCHSPESCCGLRSGQARWRRPEISEIHCSHFAKGRPEHYVCIPVVAQGETMGLLYLQTPDDAGLEVVRERMGGVHQLVQLTGMAVAAMKLKLKLENQSIRDPLTGLFNRHFMEVALERELSLAARRKTQLAVLMLDVDHFKDFNDTYGHAAGDVVLKAVANACQTTVRGEDIACRYGGEEFTIILTDITLETSFERANAIREAVSALRVSHGRDYYGEVTLSIGIALYPEDGISGDTLLRKADQALYRAKQQGRDRVLLSADPIFAA